MIALFLVGFFSKHKAIASSQISEHRYGSFESLIVLPADDQNDTVKTDYENGTDLKQKKSNSVQST
jgi:HSP20 family molecular chaperone IbpA